MSRHSPSLAFRQTGFSLIEIMVGLVIGLISIIIVMQLWSNSEGSKRTITGGNDATMGASIALTQLERDIRQAGYGFTSYSLLGCSLAYTTADGAAVTLTQLAPVTINSPLVPAGDADTDRLLVAYGTGSGESEGDPLTVVSTATSYKVTTPSAFNVGDYVIGQATTRPATCALKLGKVTAISTPSLTVTNGTAGLGVAAPIFDLGPALVIRAYAIRGGNLTVCDYTATNCGDASKLADTTVWVPVASNVVSMRAQYGRDTTNVATSKMTGVVTTYDQITPGSTADTSGLLAYCSWNRALAVRMVLVGRNPQFNKTQVTAATDPSVVGSAAAPTWSGSTVSATSPTNPTALPLTLSGDSNWQYYRYKPVETTVPLRNFLWQGSQVGYQGGSSC